MKNTVPKSAFKPKVFSYLRLVETTGRPLYISDHGKPVVKILPITREDDEDTARFRNSVVSYDSPLEPVGDTEWEALQ